MFSINARLKMFSFANVGKLRAAPAVGMGTSIDPSIPKRPAGAFALFVKDNFAPERARNGNPKARVGDIGKVLGAQWNNLADANKMLYASEAAKLWAEYNAQMTDEKRSVLAVEAKRKKQERARRLVRASVAAVQSVESALLQERKQKNGGKPKLLPNCGYILFLVEKMASLPAAERKPVTAATKKIASDWRDLPDARKSPYAARAAENAAKNRVMLDGWKQTKQRVASQFSSIAPFMAMGAWMDAMPKRPPTSYSLFVKDKFAAEKARNVKARQTEIFSALGGHWRRLADANKMRYEEKAKLQGEYDAQLTDVQGRLERLVKNGGKLRMLPNSGYILFLVEKMASLRLAERRCVTTATKKIASEWRGLPDARKSPYVARAAENAAKNRVMLDAWKQAKERVASEPSTVSPATPPPASRLVSQILFS